VFHSGTKEGAPANGSGGPYPFSDFGAVDIMFAPIVTRFITYSVPVPRFAAAYMEAILNHPWMREWIEAAQEEPWVIERYEPPVAWGGGS
jgi:glutathione S-transferase